MLDADGLGCRCGGARFVRCDSQCSLGYSSVFSFSVAGTSLPVSNMSMSGC